MGLTAEDMQNFYSQLPKRLESVIRLEQSGKPGYEQAQAIAQKKFDAVQNRSPIHLGSVQTQWITRPC